MDTKVAIAYIPVLHKGYLDFLTTVEKADVKKLYVIGDDILSAYEELDYINRKDRLRALPFQELIASLQAVSNLEVFELTKEIASTLIKCEIFVPKEDISSFVADALMPHASVMFIDIFLRWNKENIGEQKEPETETIELTDFQKEMFAVIVSESEKSADWWRQVGAALVQDGKVVGVSHNEHMPEKQLPNIFGDTRALFKKGININYVTSAHAEVGVIGMAAKQGISTNGAELYVTDFPCPYCARLIAKAGIKKVYYQKGYAVLEGDEFLKGEGIELIKVSL